MAPPPPSWSRRRSRRRWPRRRPGRSRAAAFPDGVVSGDPTPKGISLWTRFDPSGGGGTGTVELEVATDKSFRHVVARKNVKTGAASNHAVKARVAGLKAHEEYYYRFSSKSADSAVGRFRTALPADSKAPVKFAFFSCQDYTHGYYNALDVMADGDYDFVVCLGDYIYAEAYHSVKGGTGVRDDKIGRENPQQPRTSSARPSRWPTTAPSTSSTAQTRCCAPCTPSSRW